MNNSMDVETTSSYEPVQAAGLEEEVPASMWQDRKMRKRGAMTVAGLIVGSFVTLGVISAKDGHAQVETARVVDVDGRAMQKYEKDHDDDKDEATWVQGKDFPSLAPEMEVDTQYIGKQGWGTNYDHIPSPEMCAAMCQGIEKCNAYTWVKNAGLDGCPSQCWLMEGVAEKKTLKGLVSGKPPDRFPFKMPPAVKKEASGSLYCYSLMVPGGYEEGMLKWQHENKAGIFGCDQGAVFSNKPVHVADGVTAHVVNSTLKCGYGGDSMSALNSWIFIAVWQKVIDVADYKKHDWVVKVDPDAVFFPDRLSSLLNKYKDAGYINNCKYGMHGPIEVFSSRAIDTLKEDYERSWDGAAPKKCVTEQHFGQWGEDMFIDQCLSKILDVKPRPLDSDLMCESHCECDAWYWCRESHDIVSYHPFKSVESYKNCMANAMAPKPTKFIEA
mmetsp:Transcript_81870/g.171267  ORF Transcript_81870/g.171267 Transcript_81870/m.171267 type:complete len:442 (-) Transcript_81870:292-1617(-)|eukprot:CAMPEP_0206454262 /NCGR_PEP_ID=MMETSP0324_2-20121206/21036_1 /ASSEMBLY_ACC=CAM_ASM_000836 /TAXON_ID=2866 /ORGANISM="Crypthecodinium cohnii, Strain Seligo" /LENGTH=441 /DNA_ID=CAMNT_0053924709 /DNA_START=78 /DNA_END=1403 /DNA_ORIENTATION=-